MGKKIILITNTLQATMSFRLPLIKWLQSRQIMVSVVLFDDTDDSKLREIVPTVFHIKIKNTSTSPFSILRAKHDLSRLIRSLKPDLILTFMIMPNILGSLSNLKKVPLIAMVEGRGRAFQMEGIKGRTVRLFASSLLKIAFKKCKSVYFLNQEDASLFSELSIVSKEKIRLMHGIGVNLKKFCFKPLINFRSVVMVSRLLKAKGVMDFCEAAKLIKTSNQNISFTLVGPLGDIKKSSLDPYIEAGIVEWVGPKDNVQDVFWSSTISVLPSSGEGFPATIMESCATGRPCITYDVPGCREAVIDGINGKLVPPKNIEELAKAILAILSDEDKLKELSESSAKYAREHWEFEKVQEQYLSEVSQILGITVK